MKRLSKESLSQSSKENGVSHVSDAKFASLYEKADVYDDDDERQPGKTLRMLSSRKLDGVNRRLQKMFICSKCGKGFQSSKALCGHMACHSVKDKASRKKKQKVIMDSQSDTESGAKNLRRRSRRGKCKKFDDPVAGSRSKLDGYSNCSFEASAVEHEQAEEVAISLMMLSRDSSNWGGLNSIGDSSENNSVVLEDRSVSTNLVKKGGSSRPEYNVDETLRKFGCKKIKTLGDSECGYVRNGAMNVGTDVKFESLIQALGGHRRRVHLAERSDINNCDEVSAIFKGNGSQLHDFIDLNLPAPMED